MKISGTPQQALSTHLSSFFGQRSLIQVGSASKISLPMSGSCVISKMKVLQI